ncbi:MAG: metal-dependent hydrolase [Bacteroidales bacterium]|nr:metal-dependent hydrolase [Bacteroidales bacterium]
MPDLITHTAFAYFIRKRYWSGFYITVFIIGAVLPDVFSRLRIIADDYHWFLSTFHTPFVLILLSLLISRFFAPGLRKRVFKILLMGVASHFVLDILQLGIDDKGNNLFFPFTDWDIQLGIFWPEDSLLLIPFILCYFLILFLIKYIKRYKFKTQ